MIFSNQTLRFFSYADFYDARSIIDCTSLAEQKLQNRIV